MSATPHESQPNAVSHARGKYTSVPKTTPPAEAMPSQAASTSDRSGRRASSLARAVLMRRLGSTTLRAIDRAGTHVCPCTDGQQVECCSDAEGVHARPRTDARTQQAQPRIEQGRADQKVAEQHVVAVQSRLDEPVAQVPSPVKRVCTRPHAA
eukprot:scaffold5200_cov69-Phaeocystis_antarctica.AAC.1